MAAVALMPRVRIMAICDGVRESKIEAGVFNLKGVRQGITADAFPFTPSRLWLFLLLSSPRPGVFPGYVRVVNEQTWVAPIFCTRCYESMAWGFSAGGSPGAPCSAVHMAANAAGVRYSNALCGRRWL